MKSQREDQAAMIQAFKRKVMSARAPDMDFVNKGDPSHGVESGPDRRNADAPMKVDACGYGFKGYDPLAWKY